jgi:hypothetical protein
MAPTDNGFHIDVAASFASSEPRANQTGNAVAGSAQIFGLDLLQINRDFQVEQHRVLVISRVSLMSQ